MTSDDIRAFVKRDWALLERLEEDQRAESYRTLGWQASRKLALSLYDHALQVSPGFPQKDAQAEDLDHHIPVKRLIDRARHAITTR
ncbi:MAG: hypothetical protein IPM54_20145 [Polyangiaceae bacterium]|nr:hypothetical protein [Polyangiaceae bacterium]